MQATVRKEFFDDPAQVAAKFVLGEVDYGKDGAEVFIASRPVFDWDAVRMQMLYLHGQAKIRRTDA